MPLEVTDPAFVERLGEDLVSATTPEPVEEHRVGIIHCELVPTDLRSDAATLTDGGVGPLPVSSPTGIAAGERLGRYVAQQRLGRGGMGEVWLAHDEELDRDVAVKLLRPDRHDRAGGRMLREAQAMARLRHPNVVTVYDVGTWNDRIFVAMEYVRGRTLKVWLGETRRSLREIVDAFDGAAEGLAAAHEADLVHRDFKPENVMVDEHGRVQVMDFGLARAPGADDPPPEQLRSEELDVRSSGNLVSARLTATGALMGTPAYMAPEQFLKTGADARTDQFAFAVALYESLYGERPFAGLSPMEIAANVSAGEIRPAPKGSTVPSRLRRVLLRALERVADDRYPSMRGLQRAVAEAVRPRWAPVGVVGVVGLGALVAAAGSSAAPEDPCAEAGAAVAIAWDDAARTSTEQAFAASGLGFAAEAFIRFDEEVTAYAEALSAEADEACRDTRVRGVQSEPALDLRLVCLRDEQRQLDRLLHVARDADADFVVAAIPGLAKMRDPTACRRSAQAAAPASSEDIPAELREELSEIELAYDLGREDEARAAAAALVERLEPEGPSPALVHALIITGLGSDPDGEARLERAVWLATELGLDRWAARAAGTLVNQAYRRDPSAAGRWMAHAEALLRHLDGADAALQQRIDVVRLEYQLLRGDYDAVVQGADPLLEDPAGGLSSRYMQVMVRDVLASALQRQGDLKGALEQNERALQLLTDMFGPGHPDTALQRVELAEVLAATGRNERAETELHKALGIFERAYGPESERFHRSLRGLAVVRFSKGDYEAALPFLERMHDQAEARANVPDAAVAETSSMLGVAYWFLGRYREAELLHLRALETAEAIFGSDNPRTAMYTDNLATALERQGKIEEALEMHRRALPILERVMGKDSPSVAVSLRDQARALRSAERWDEAQELLERSVRNFQRSGAAPTEVAESRFDLARALWPDDTARPRAISLAHWARGAYVEAGRTERVAEIDAWLAERVDPAEPEDAP